MTSIKQDYDINKEFDLYEKFIEFKNESLSDLPDEQAMSMMHSFIYLLVCR